MKSFVNRESDFPFDSRHFSREDLIKQGYDSTLFDESIDYISQPTFENGSYKVVKITEKVMMPDSVKASHILLSFQKYPKAQAEFKADSLKQVIDAGADFVATAVAVAAAVAGAGAEYEFIFHISYSVGLCCRCRCCGRRRSSGGPDDARIQIGSND